MIQCHSVILVSPHISSPHSFHNTPYLRSRISNTLSKPSASWFTQATIFLYESPQNCFTANLPIILLLSWLWTHFTKSCCLRPNLQKQQTHVPLKSHSRYGNGWHLTHPTSPPIHTSPISSVLGIPPSKTHWTSPETSHVFLSPNTPHTYIIHVPQCENLDIKTPPHPPRTLVKR